MQSPSWTPCGAEGAVGGACRLYVPVHTLCTPGSSQWFLMRLLAERPLSKCRGRGWAWGGKRPRDPGVTGQVWSELDGTGRVIRVEREQDEHWRETQALESSCFGDPSELRWVAWRPPGREPGWHSLGLAAIEGGGQLGCPWEGGPQAELPVQVGP